MKRCPECRKDYIDDSVLYCLDEGAALVQGSVSDEPATALLSGHELFYVQNDGKMMAVEIKPGDPPGIGAAQTLFDIAAVRTPRTQDYNVSNDGQRFLFISRGADAVSPPLVVILNWSTALNR